MSQTPRHLQPPSANYNFSTHTHMCKCMGAPNIPPSAAFSYLTALVWLVVRLRGNVDGTGPRHSSLGGSFTCNFHKYFRSVIFSSFNFHFRIFRTVMTFSVITVFFYTFNIFLASASSGLWNFRPCLPYCMYACVTRLRNKAHCLHSQSVLV